MKYFLVIILLVFSLGCSNQYTIKVFSGEHDRKHSVVRFKLPDNPDRENLVVVSDNGLVLPLQKIGNGEAIFIIPELKANQELSFKIEENQGKIANIISSEEAGRYEFSMENQPIITYQYQPILPSDTISAAYRRGGYIHPVYTPAGQIVTDDFPSNHLHHHGIWAAWTKTKFQERTPDFWNMGKETGTVVPVALDSSWSGPVMAGLKSRHNYIDLTSENVTAINESWEVNVYPVHRGESDFMMFDLHQVNQCATDDALFLPTYHYGGVGFRGNGQWNGAENTNFLTSEGKTRENGHATKADWCHIGGMIDDKLAGITIMCHPDNFRAPQPMRIHPNEPFFCYAPSQGGDWSIQPGETYEARYRYIVYDGEPDAELLEQLWLDYADPVSVSVIK